MSKIKVAPNKRRGMKRLSSLIEPIISRATENHGALYTKICFSWPDIASDMITWSYPKSLTFAKSTRHNGTLTVWVSSGRGPETQTRSQELISSINMVCGFKAVAKIIPQQTFELLKKTPKPHRNFYKTSSSLLLTNIDKTLLNKLEKQTNDFTSPELRATLIRLGATINSKNNTVERDY